MIFWDTICYLKQLLLIYLGHMLILRQTECHANFSKESWGKKKRKKNKKSTGDKNSIYTRLPTSKILLYKIFQTLLEIMCLSNWLQISYFIILALLLMWAKEKGKNLPVDSEALTRYTEEAFDKYWNNNEKLKRRFFFIFKEAPYLFKFSLFGLTFFCPLTSTNFHYLYLLKLNQIYLV